MDLFDAARAGDLDALQAHLGNGADLHARDAGDNASALHWAAASGELDAVRVLVDAGADVNCDGDDHRLSVIGWASCFEPHAHIAEYLVECGARHHIFSALALELDDEVRAIVAAAPGALNQRMSHNEDFQLPLHFAVRKGLGSMVALLVDLGADPLGVDGAGHSVAAYATTPDVDRPVMEAIRALTGGSHLSALALHDFEPAGLDPGALHLMAKRGDVTAVRWLIDEGVDPDALWTHWGAEVTALHLAAAYGHEDTAQALLEAGADPALRDSLHDSDALGWAKYFEQPAVVALLEDRLSTETTSVVLEFREDSPHVRELIDAFEDAWVVGIASQAGIVRLALETPGATWGAAVTLVEGRLERLPFDWRSHAACRRP
jgi:ankyrin repeat protein